MGVVSQQTHDTPILNWILNFWVQDQYYLGSPCVFRSQTVLILMRILAVPHLILQLDPLRLHEGRKEGRKEGLKGKNLGVAPWLFLPPPPRA